MILGYARVSTRDQNLDGQRDAVAAVGAERIFADTIPDDPAVLKAMVAALQAENAKMSATIRAHDQLIQTSRWKRASGATAAHREAQEAGLRQVFGEDRARDRTAGTGP